MPQAQSLQDNQTESELGLSLTHECEDSPFRFTALWRLSFTSSNDTTIARSFASAIWTNPRFGNYFRIQLPYKTVGNRSYLGVTSLGKSIHSYSLKMLVYGFFISALLCAFVVDAAPPPELVKRQAITPLTTAQISAFKPFTFFASTAYCNPSNTLAWNCGANCNANADFVPVASGGDGSDVQFWYVGFSPSQKTVIVAHQGTVPSQIEADATDLDTLLEPLNPTLFPGISSSIQAHSGFANEQAKTATTILAAVRTAISAHSATKVTIVGHSLGAALALLDSVYLPLHISGVTFSTVGYGMPRVGNHAFANYVDAHLSLTHINNKKDPVPIVPGRFLGYHHPSGEVHIMASGSWVSCPGQDNPSTECIVGDVPNIFEGNTNDHAGPYDGVTLRC